MPRLLTVAILMISAMPLRTWSIGRVRSIEKSRKTFDDAW